MSSILRIESGARMSQAVVANGFILLAGQVAGDPSKDVEDQTRQVLAEIERLLAAAGADKQRIREAPAPNAASSPTAMRGRRVATPINEPISRDTALSAPKMPAQMT